MIEREQLIKIPALTLTGYIETMDNNQFERYSHEIDVFIDGFPAQETAVKATMEAKDFNAFSEHLTTIKKRLDVIRAEELAAQCSKLMGIFTSENREAAEAAVLKFLTMVAALSIDLQMVLYHKERPETADSAPSPIDGVKQKTILAVDDSAFFLNMLKTYLNDSEYKLTCVNSGAAALRFLTERTPDLLIFDIEMPMMDGYELAQKVVEKGIKVPIIFLTGNAAKEYVIKAIQAGASDFITKPIDKAQVLERIKKFIG